MDVAVDRARRQRRALGVDRRRRAAKIEVFGATKGRNAAVDRDERIRFEDRLSEVAAQHQADVLDDEFGRLAAAGGFVMGHVRSREASASNSTPGS